MRKVRIGALACFAMIASPGCKKKDSPEKESAARSAKPTQDGAKANEVKTPAEAKPDATGAGAEADAAKAQAAKPALPAPDANPGAAMKLAPMLPAGVDNVIAVDLQRTAKSPLWKEFRSTLDQSEDIKPVLAGLAKCKIQEADLHQLLVGFDGKSLGSGYVLLQGENIGELERVRCLLDFVDSEQKATAAKNAKSQKKKKGAPKKVEKGYTEEKRGERVIFALHPEKLQAALAEDGSDSAGLDVEKQYLVPIDAQHVAISEASKLDALLAHLADPKSSALDSGLKPIAAHIGGEQSVLIAGIAPKTVSDSLRDYDVQGVQDYQIRVDLTDTLTLAIALGMENRAQAAMAADALKGRLQEQKPLLALMALPGKLIDDVKIANDAERVRMQLELTAADLLTIKQAMAGAMGGAAPAGGAAPVAEP